MKKTIAVIGAGGNAREIAGIIHDLGTYEFAGFLGDGKGQHDSPTLGNFDWLEKNHVDCLAMGIGSPKLKVSISAKLKAQFPAIAWPTLIHPTAYVGPTCKLSEGVIVCVGVVLTENVQAGALTQFNFSSIVGHESSFGKGCLINPGAKIAGGVEVGKEVMIGIGAQVLQYLKIGDYAIVGAGAVVTKSVESRSTVVGVPARKLMKTAAASA